MSILMRVLKAMNLKLRYLIVLWESFRVLRLGILAYFKESMV